MSRGERRPSVSLVIATYNWPVALDRVLASVLAQQSPPEQVLIADDGSTADTARVVERWRPAFGERLVHVWRPDDGFRAGEVRNRAARDATGELLVFVDGDCLLRPDVIARHRQLAEPGCAVAGNRVLLSRALTEAIEAGRANPLDWQLADWWRARRGGDVGRLFPLLTLPGQAWRRSRPRHWLQFRSCNIAVWRDDYVRVNGFDERISGWGFEDSDLAIRLINAGVRIKSGRFATAVLHLWHQERPRDQAERNRAHALAMLRDQVVRAAQGLAERDPGDRYPPPTPGPALPGQAVIERPIAGVAEVGPVAGLGPVDRLGPVAAVAPVAPAEPIPRRGPVSTLGATPPLGQRNDTGHAGSSPAR